MHCIALRTVRLSDSKNLLSVWSREAGRITFAVPAGASREARRRRAITAPLGAFEGVCDIRPDREIHSVRDVMPMAGSAAMNPSPQQTLTSLFLAEVLDRLLASCAPDDVLSDYLFSSFEIFKNLKGRAAANFHLLFLFGLSYFTGIAPDLDGYARGAVFDLRDGRFRTAEPLHHDIVEGDMARALPLLAALPLSKGGRLRLSREQRNDALDMILRYFSFHLVPLDSIKSLEILRGL